MTTIELILFALTIWAIREFIVIILINKDRRGYIHKIRVEQIREYFAKLRIDTLNLARDEKLDINSYTFKLLYVMQTFVLRRPDEYKKLSKHFADSFLFKSGTTAPPEWMITEAATWSAEAREIVIRTGEGLMLLVTKF